MGGKSNTYVARDYISLDERRVEAGEDNTKDSDFVASTSWTKILPTNHDTLFLLHMSTKMNTVSIVKKMMPHKSRNILTFFF